MDHTHAKQAEDALATFYGYEKEGFAFAAVAHAMLHLIEMAESLPDDGPPRRVVQYDFEDGNTLAYCNDGTVWVLHSATEWEPRVTAMIPE
jgi:hypothetical protein